MQLTITHQNKSCIVRYLAPLVKIKGNGIGAFNARQLWGNICGQHAQRAKSAIHMKPDTETRCDVGNFS